MKNNTLIIAFCLLAFLLKGQQGFDPKIVILLPEKVKIPDEVNDEITFIEEKMIFKEKKILENNMDSLVNGLDKNDTIAINLKTHYLNQLDFYYYLDFPNYIIREYASKFQLELSKSFNNVLVNISPNKSLNDLKFLRSVASMEKADYVILNPLLTIAEKSGEIMVKPVFKIYSSIEEKIIDISELITEDFHTDTIVADNKKFKINYDNNFASQIQKIIIQNGNSSGRLINKQRQILLSEIFEVNKTNDTIKGIIVFSDINLKISNYYTGLYNSKTNQFLAFFIEDYTSSESDNIKPKYLINLVYFVKKSKKWKYKFIIKDAVSAANLSKEERLKGMFYNYINYNLFKENSYSVNEIFWKKKIFYKYSMQF